MAEVLQVFTIQRRLFKPDAVPWPYLVLQSNLGLLRERYRFTQLGLSQPSDTLPAIARVVAKTGEFKIGDKLQAVEQLLIEPTVVQFQISADSSAADLYFDDIASFFTQIDPNKVFSLANEQTRTYQTIVIARLTAPFDAILSGSFRSFLRDTVVPRFRLADTDVEVDLEHLSWAVKYRPQSTEFTYIPKVLTIEPRHGTKEADRIYYTLSPTDFKTHMELLKAFEKSFTPSSS